MPCYRCESFALENLISKGKSYENDISAVKEETCAKNRVPCPYGDSERTEGSCPPPPQGPREPDRRLTVVSMMNPAGPTDAEPRRSASFGRSVRLLLNNDFQRVFEQGRSIAGKTMVIWIGAGTGNGVRMGVVASKRTFRRAVDRNRAKRLIREAFRQERDGLSGSADLVIIARQRILDAGAVAAREEFRKLARTLAMKVDGGFKG